MKLVTLGGDTSILIEGTKSRARMVGYSHVFEELHIVVASREARGRPQTGNLFTYAAAGRSFLPRMLQALRIGDIICRAVKPDVISAENADVFGLIGYVLSRRHGIPLQVQVHTDIFSSHYPRASWKERIRYSLATFVLPRADGVRVVSKRVAEGARRRLGIPRSRIRVLPIHTDVEEHRTATRDQATDARFREYGFRVISTGRFIDREKNFSLLLDVMADLRGEIPGVVLVIAGEGPDRRRYERAIASRGLEDSVRLVPWRNDLPSFLKSFEVCLLSSNYEGWGRGCVEAAAAGLPVVMTDVGLAGELLIDGISALVVPVGDRRAMSRAIQRLFSDPHERRRLVQAAQAAIDRMPYRSMDDYYRAYLEAVEACLSC